MLALICMPYAAAQSGAPVTPTGASDEAQVPDAASQSQNQAAGESTATTPTEPSVESAAEQSSGEQAASKTNDKQKVFKPSEEISEDRPVPFPVDI